MKDRYRLVLRNTTFYAHNRQTGQRVSLETNNREKAKRLLLAKNEAHSQPLLNTAIAKVYLTVQDPVLVQRTWQEVMESYASRGKDSTRERVRRELSRKIFNSICGLRLVETTVSHFETVLTEGSASTSNYLRRLHNLSVRRGWLLQPLMSPADWPVATPQPRRAVTAEEHAKIVDGENDPERRRYYQMLWETGGAQSDVAELTWENVDRAKNVLVYHRKKTGEKCQLKIGPTLCDLMSHLPQNGAFFPAQSRIEAKHRASEFRRRCRVLKITGISPHSYRYAWAERACSAGYPERFAQAALGHKSRAVHRAYSRRADIVCPSLEEYQTRKQPTQSSVKIARKTL